MPEYAPRQRPPSEPPNADADEVSGQSSITSRHVNGVPTFTRLGAMLAGNRNRVKQTSDLHASGSFRDNPEAKARGFAMQ